jgi:hypothetical protein
MDSSNDDIPIVEMELAVTPITVKTKKLAANWTVKISPFMISYMFGIVALTDTRTGRTRDVTKLLAAIRKREENNTLLGIRKVFKDWHVFITGSNCRHVSQKNLDYMIKRFLERPVYYIKKYRKYGLHGDGPV